MTDQIVYRHLNGLVKKKQVKKTTISKYNVEYSFVLPKDDLEYKKILDNFSSLPLGNLAAWYVELAGIMAYRHLEIFMERTLGEGKPEELNKRMEENTASFRAQWGLLRIVMSQKDKTEFKEVLLRLKEKLKADGLEV